VLAAKQDPAAISSTVGPKQALVTGGTSGIGQAIGLALAAGGYRVLSTGLTDAEVERFRGSLPAGNAIAAATLDVSDPTDVGRVSSLPRLIFSPMPPARSAVAGRSTTRLCLPR
jgi:NADPH:quinone reductase-like Zn-dependent oxidoreductase